MKTVEYGRTKNISKINTKPWQIFTNYLSMQQIRKRHGLKGPHRLLVVPLRSQKRCNVGLCPIRLCLHHDDLRP